MQDYITKDRIVNAINMTDDSTRLHLVVEGKIDYKVYPRFFASSRIIPHRANGYETILGIFDTVTKENAIGLIDSDFRKIDGVSIQDERIIMTDYHDLEIMIVESVCTNIFEDLFIEKKEKIQEVLGTETLADYVKKQGRIIAILRYMNYSTSDSYGLRFKELNYAKMIGKDENKIIDLVIDCSTRLNDLVRFDKKHKETVIEMYVKSAKQKFDELQLLNGHDFVLLLLYTTNFVLKKSNSKMNFINEEQLVITLCMNYISSGSFEETEMYKKIIEFLTKKNFHDAII